MEKGAIRIARELECHVFLKNIVATGCKKTQNYEWYPFGWRALHCHWDRRIVGKSDVTGCQPSTFVALVASATSCAGSPGRRGSHRTLMSLPVTLFALSMTFRTEYPTPVPRFMNSDLPPFRR